MKSVIVLVISLSAISLLTGCAVIGDRPVVSSSTDEIPSVMDQFPRQFSELKPGMSVQEVWAILNKIPPATYVLLRGTQLPPRFLEVYKESDKSIWEYRRQIEYLTAGDVSRHRLIIGIGAPGGRPHDQTVLFSFEGGKMVKFHDKRVLEQKQSISSATVNSMF
jgi:hypothetical protein